MSNKKKAEQLGMPIGTAQNRLRKRILFHLIKILKLDTCYRCKQKIKNEKELSIEHKIPWLDSNNPKVLFFDINNITFSHLSCNVKSRRIPHKGNKGDHGTSSRYVYWKCRCKKCRRYNRDRERIRRKKALLFNGRT